MPKSRLGRLLFALFVLGSLCITGRNLYRRSLNRALIAAVESQNVASVRALLNRGADVTAHVIDPTGKDTKQSVLSLALYNNRSAVESDEISLLMLKQSASRSETAAHGESYLIDACRDGKVSQVRLLLEAGINPNCKDTGTNTPVSSALEHIRYYDSRSLNTKEAQKERRNTAQAIIRLLREHGAILSLAQLAEVGGTAEIKSRLEAGELPDPRQAHQDTALCVASSQGNLDMMKMLLAHGADINRSGVQYGTPLEAAASYAHIDAINLLLAQGAEVNAKRSGTLLAAAINSKNAQAVRVLLAHGAKPTLPHSNKTTSWILEDAIRQVPEVVPDLLAQGADVNAGNGKPLNAALQANRPDLVRELLRYRAKVRFSSAEPFLSSAGIRLPNGAAPSEIHSRPSWPPGFVRVFLPLMTAVRYAPDCVEMLLHAGADVNEMDINGETPLTQALLYAPATVEILLKHGAKVNIVTHAQRTPLDIAAALGDANSVRLLLAYDADINARPQRGHTPLYYAHRKNQTDIILLFKQRGAVEE